MTADVDLRSAATAAERLWRLDPGGAEAVVNGVTATIRFPVAEAAVHVSRVLPSPARVQALQTARARLAECGLPVVALLPSINGALWESWQDRYLEVEPWVDHDGRMNTWSRLRIGAPILAAVHNAWADLDLGPVGEICTWANWISPTEATEHAPDAAQRLTDWGLDGLAQDVLRLTRLSSVDAPLPQQIVHGDFWDNNVYLRDDEIVAITDFDFLGRRPRIDDLSLMLYFADEQPYFTDSTERTSEQRLADLAPLVKTYNQALSRPLSDAELTALPFTIARQPLWTYSKRIVEAVDQDRAQRDAVETAPAVGRALTILDDPEAWSHAFAP